MYLFFFKQWTMQILNIKILSFLLSQFLLGKQTLLQKGGPFCWRPFHYVDFLCAITTKYIQTNFI